MDNTLGRHQFLGSFMDQSNYKLGGVQNMYADG